MFQDASIAAFFLQRWQIKRKKPAPQASGRKPKRRKEGKGEERKGTVKGTEGNGRKGTGRRTERLRSLLPYGLGDYRSKVYRDGTLRGLVSRRCVYKRIGAMKAKMTTFLARELATN